MITQLKKHHVFVFHFDVLTMANRSPYCIIAIQDNKGTNKKGIYNVLIRHFTNEHNSSRNAKQLGSNRISVETRFNLVSRHLYVIYHHILVEFIKGSIGYYISQSLNYNDNYAWILFLSVSIARIISRHCLASESRISESEFVHARCRCLHLFMNKAEFIVTFAVM